MGPFKFYFRKKVSKQAGIASLQKLKITHLTSVMVLLLLKQKMSHEQNSCTIEVD